MPYRKLDVYQKAYNEALEIHKITLTFPDSEKFAMAQQMRGASKSIPVMIAEGMGKQESADDVRRFVRMALGSCDEMRVWLDFARDLKYLDQTVYKVHYDRYCEIGRMLNGLIKRFGPSKPMILSQKSQSLNQ